MALKYGGDRSRGSMSTHFERGRALRALNKYAEAEVEFRKALAENPGDVPSHAMLALMLAGQNKFDKARKEGLEAVRLAPDAAYPFYILSIIDSLGGRKKDAEKSIKEALRLDPTDPDYYEHAGELKFANKKWQETIKLAEEALQYDPQHVNSLNLLSRTLLRIGRFNEAQKWIDLSLSLQPENSTTHANKGWVLVNQGRAKEAFEHFREALRLDPNSDWAYLGVVEALKARNPIYYLFLRSSLSMSEMSQSFRRAIYWICWIIPPLRALLILIFLCTFLTDTLFTALLRLDPLGRTVLQDKTKKSNNRRLVAVIAIMAFIVWACAMPSESNALLMRAKRAAAKGDHVQAKKLCENILAKADDLKRQLRNIAAENCLKELADSLDSIGADADIKARTYIALAENYLQEGLDESAVDNLQIALGEARNLRDKTIYAAALGDLAMAQANQAKFKNAAVSFDAALATLKQTGKTKDPLYLKISSNYADVLRKHGDTKKADEISAEAAAVGK
jgi:tetratricopeptide (TPR) repeat protein